MPSKIETELRNRCAATENFRLLLAQWEYDRLLLGQALTTVSHTFPHYSLHDASHSETILERIASMLGTAALSYLSATDLWLLLEAAYLHDSGMVVLAPSRRKDLESTEFESHLRATAEGEDQELAARARRLLDKHLPQDPAGMLDGHFDLLFVYAEFVRKRHARRAEAVVLSPLETTRIESPRTPLVPNRFWYIIGRICRAHGENLEFVLRELPFEESGFGGELCHPRFVACMLRLGDLLDLDSGRFCPTINATIPRLPETSEAHRGKHAGIRHLLVCPSRIEVSGVYSDLNSYLEAERWFSWLREELSAQLVQWAEVAPSNYGTLPSAGRIEAHLEGQITLAPASRPRFEVDREKMIELVQGANIYGGPEDAVREIIQNAIDATLLRYSYESQARGYSPPSSLNELREQLKIYPISVSLRRNSALSEDEDRVEWTLSVTDQGIGMRIEDAKLMLTLGSSKRNHYRKALRDWLPEWARPSGTFGIGFHSLFLYSQEVHVVTRHTDDPNGLDLTFTASAPNAEPAVIIRQRTRPGKDIKFTAQAGTLVEAKLWVDRIPAQSSSILFNRPRRGMTAFQRYDFVLDKEIPLAPAAITELVFRMANGSPCALRPLSLPIREDDIDRLSPPDVWLYHFDAEDCMEVRIADLTLWSGRIFPKYRGSPTEGLLDLSPFVGECDLHASDASTMLELSRNLLTKEGWQAIESRLRSVLRKALPGWLANLRRSPSADGESIGLLSLYGMLNDIAGCGDEWRSVQFHESVTIGTIADASSITWIKLPSGSHNAKVEIVDGQLVIRNAGITWLDEFMVKYFPSRLLELVSDDDLTIGVRRYRLAKEPTGEDVTDEALATLLWASRKSHKLVSRAVLPCPRRFASLSFDPLVIEGRAPFGDRVIHTSIASPFVYRGMTLGAANTVDVPDVEGYARWLAKQRSESQETIAEELFSFIKYVDQLMRNKWHKMKNYDLKEIERDLSRIAKG